MKVGLPLLIVLCLLVGMACVYTGSPILAAINFFNAGFNLCHFIFRMTIFNHHEVTNV